LKPPSKERKMHIRLRCCRYPHPDPSLHHAYKGFNSPDVEAAAQSCARMKFQTGEPNRRGIVAAHASLAELLALAACVVGWTTWMWLTAGHAGWRLWAANASLVTIFSVWGRVLLVALGIDRLVPRGFLLSLLTGALAVTFCIAAARLLTPIGLLAWYGAAWGVGGLLYLLLARRIGAWQPLPRGRWRELGATVLALAAVTLWIQHVSPLVIVTGNESNYRPFIEYFFHTTHATPLLIDGTPVSQGMFQFAGVPLPYYHYASYAVPALVAWIAGCPVYDAMVGSWYPVGYFLLGAAAWSLGNVLFGPRAARWCLVAVLLVPDPSYWCAPLKLFSLDAFAEASPALSYASACAALSVILMTLAARTRRIDLVAAAVVVAGMTVFFKANVVVAALPLAGLYFLANWSRFENRARWSALIALIVLGLLGVAAGTRLRSAPTIGLDPDVGKQYANYVLDEVIPPKSALQNLRPWVQSANRWIAVPGRLALIAVVTFQLGLVALVAALVACAWCWPGARAHRRLLIAALAIYLGSAVFLPPNANGDPYELQHRAFYWIYFLGAVWVAGVAVRLYRGVGRRTLPGYVVACILLCVPLVLGRESRVAPEKPVPTSLVRAAQYVLTHGPSTDIVQDAENDPHLIIAALSQRRSYICISLEDTFPGSGALRAIHTGRAAECQALLQAKTREELASFAQRTGVRWFVLQPDSQVAWPSDIVGAPAFQDRGFRVFDLSAVAGGGAP